MNHQPFEDWLLDPGSLDTKKKHELQAHLQTCPECMALAEVELALHTARMESPAAGFAERFQGRLIKHKQALRRRIFWGFLMMTIGVIAILLWLSWSRLGPMLQSPVNTLAGWISWLIALWTSLQAIGQVSKLIFQVLPGFVPPFVWISLLLGAGAWSMLYILSLVKYSKHWQGV